MDYTLVLENENSKKSWLSIVDDVGTDAQKFEVAMNIFLSTDYRMVQRISQSIGMIGEKQPQLIAPYLPRMVHLLRDAPIDAVKRNVLRIFQFVNVPEAIEGELFDIAMKYLISRHEAIAIKAFSMTALRRICEKYPELTQEVIPTLELIIRENDSPGIQSRGRKELKLLRRIAAKKNP